MSDPIGRKTIYLDDALEAIRKLPNAGIHWLISAEAVFDALLRLPSAQPEIIRCRDCKHYTLKPQVNSNNCYIRHCTRSALISSKPDDYCSWAERRTDG